MYKVVNIMGTYTRTFGTDRPYTPEEVFSSGEVAR
jgi:hypothetical protein